MIKTDLRFLVSKDIGVFFITIFGLAAMAAITGNQSFFGGSLIKSSSAYTWPNPPCVGWYEVSLPITYEIDSSNSAEGSAAIKDALSLWWNTMDQISFKQVTSSPDILFTVASSSSMGTLWTSYNGIQCSTSDAVVHWNSYLNPTQCQGSNGNEFVDCVGLYAHEIGHALGLGHDSDNYGLDLMDPSTATAFVIAPTYDEQNGAADGWGTLQTQGFST